MRDEHDKVTVDCFDEELGQAIFQEWMKGLADGDENDWELDIKQPERDKQCHAGLEFD